jgi:hypothetical protein
VHVHNVPFVATVPQHKGAAAQRFATQVEADNGNIARLLFQQVFGMNSKLRHSCRLLACNKLRKRSTHSSFATEPFTLMFSGKKRRRIISPPRHHFGELKVRKGLKKGL